ESPESLSSRSGRISAASPRARFFKSRDFFPKRSPATRAYLSALSRATARRLAPRLGSKMYINAAPTPRPPRRAAVLPLFECVWKRLISAPCGRTTFANPLFVEQDSDQTPTSKRQAKEFARLSRVDPSVASLSSARLPAGSPVHVLRRLDPDLPALIARVQA